MAHSYVTFKGNDQLFTDSLISLLMDLATKEWRSVALKDDSFVALQPLFEWWSDLASHPGPGCVDLKLDENLSTDFSLAQLKQLFEILEEDLTRRSEHLSKDELNNVSSRGGAFTCDLKTTVVLDSIHKMRALLDTRNQEDICFLTKNDAVSPRPTRRRGS